MSDPRFHAVVLAGERPGGGVLARELKLPAGVLAPLAGRPCLLRVLDALGGAACVAGVTLCGPDSAVIDGSPALADLRRNSDLHWLPPQRGPAASAAAAVAAAPGFPILLTSGDHGLLTAAMVDDFAERARAAAAVGSFDVVVGLVPFDAVRDAFPESRRTVLRFADAALCGSNLFALFGEPARAALAFWSGVEAERKRPWRIARRLGPTVLLRYLLGRLPVDAAFEVLSERAGCRVGWVALPWPRAAVDVDSAADWRLAERLLREDLKPGAAR
ncbi:MAG TPA: NTP transferase domain-containing protein [Pseudomonadales bacterium]